MTDHFRVFDHAADLPPGSVVMDALGHVSAVSRGTFGKTVLASYPTGRLPQPPFIELLDARSAGHAFGVLEDYITRMEGPKR